MQSAQAADLRDQALALTPAPCLHLQDGVRGYYLARQGQHCHFPNWQELEVDPVARAEGQRDGHLHMGAVTLRAFKNSAGSLRG